MAEPPGAARRVDPRFGVDRFAAVRLGVDRPRDPERLARLERRAEVVCLLATVSATLPTVTDSGAEPPENPAMGGVGRRRRSDP